MKVTLEMVLTRFFAQHKEANLFSEITDTQMHHALLGIQLLPRHMENLSADYLYVTDQFYYSAQISRDCRKVKPDMSIRRILQKPIFLLLYLARRHLTLEI